MRRFHDSLLSYGSVPVALIAEEMRGQEPASPGQPRAAP
jgi:hypothetical protein